MDEIISELRNLKKKGNPEEFFGKLLHSRNVIHLAHLKTKSYAAHKALGDYYEDIVDLTDGIIEAYQGLYGLVTLTVPAASLEEPVKYLTDLHSYIDSAKSGFTDSALLNQIDEVKSLIQSTLYKLKNLS